MRRYGKLATDGRAIASGDAPFTMLIWPTGEGLIQRVDPFVRV